MSWRYLNDLTPKARKQYHCRLCGEVIEKGERHLARVGINDGRISTIRFHNKCIELTNDWTESDWESIGEGEYYE